MRAPAATGAGAPAAAGIASEWAPAWCLLPAAVLGLLTLPFIYRDCVGDPDTLLMINGVVERPAPADMWVPTHKYGVVFSWGYYWLLYHLPAGIREQPSRLIAAVNLLGWLSAVLTCGALGLLMQRVHGTARSLALTIPLALSPMLLQVATYGHPFTLSAALLFAGGMALLDAESRSGAASIAGRVLSALLLFASLAVRADAVLALPWMALVALDTPGARARVRRVVERGIVFAVAFLAFLLVQRGIATERGELLTSAGAFLQSFYHLRTAFRGVTILALTSGLALVATVLMMSLRDRRSPIRGRWAPLVLLAPALLFWLPVPTPARHFFFALVALAEMFALHAVHRFGARRAVALALTVVLLNQVAAEILHRPIQRWYWPNEPPSRRQATGSVTLGASLPYHQVMHAQHRRLREEGRRLARIEEPEVIFFGNFCDYVILALLEREGPRSWRDSVEAGVWAARIERPGQTFHIIRTAPYGRRDDVAEYLAVDPFPRAKVYVQPSSTRPEGAGVPAGRALTLP